MSTIGYHNIYSFFITVGMSCSILSKADRVLNMYKFEEHHLHLFWGNIFCSSKTSALCAEVHGLKPWVVCRNCNPSLNCKTSGIKVFGKCDEKCQVKSSAILMISLVTSKYARAAGRWFMKKDKEEEPYKLKERRPFITVQSLDNRQDKRFSCF